MKNQTSKLDTSRSPVMATGEVRLWVIQATTRARNFASDA